MKTNNQKFEKERLQAIQPYVLVDGQAILNNLVKLASQVCGTEISLVTLLDRDVQWFKAKHGIDIDKTSRDVAFCNVAIEGKDILEVEDATNDSRFSDNPLVIAEPNIRFYAGAPVINSQGYPLGTLCVIDSKPGKLTSKQKRALLDIRDLVVTCLDRSLNEKRAKEEIESKNELIKLMSKEMLDPMNTILGLTEMMKEGSVTENNISQLHQSAEQLHGMISSMLDFQHIKEGKVEAQELILDLNGILQQVKSEAEEQFNLKIKLNLDLSIPKLVMGDTQRVGQVLNYLVDFSKRNSKDNQIRLSAELREEHNNYYRIHFSSSVKGIVDKQLPSDKLKDLLDGGESTVARDLINMLGGELIVRTINNITEVSFTLTFKKAPVDTNLPSDEYIPDFDNVKILLVDDLATNRIILGKFLEKWGIAYDVAEEGESAVKLAFKNHYDLILMDLRMPGIDGFEATKRIRKKKNVPIIALTASLATFDDNAYISSAIDDLLAKPFHPQDLKQKIYRLLNAVK
ncbi:MAG: response regulator [Fulvivirga sp.]